jgi:hypothetical protein
MFSPLQHTGVFASHSKSQKIIKWKIQLCWILNECNYTMTYNMVYLVYFFTVMEKSIDLKLLKKYVLKYSILYVYGVELLILSPNNLIFHFMIFL